MMGLAVTCLRRELGKVVFLQSMPVMMPEDQKPLSTPWKSLWLTLHTSPAKAAENQHDHLAYITQIGSISAMKNSSSISDGSWEAVVLPDVKILPASRSSTGPACSVSHLQQRVLGETKAALPVAYPAQLMSGSKGGLRFSCWYWPSQSRSPRPM